MNKHIRAECLCLAPGMKCHGCLVNEYISELESTIDAVKQYGVDPELSGTPTLLWYHSDEHGGYALLSDGDKLIWRFRDLHQYGRSDNAGAIMELGCTWDFDHECFTDHNQFIDYIRNRLAFDEEVSGMSDNRIVDALVMIGKQCENIKREGGEKHNEMGLW